MGFARESNGVLPKLLHLGLIVGLAAPSWLAAAGCHGPVAKSRSPLAPARMSEDAVALDIFFVRFPIDSEEANQTLWEEIDEQHLPALLRQRLAENGFRAGVVAGPLPVALSNLMDLSEKPVSTTQTHTTDLADLDTKPRVLRRYLPLRAGKPGEIVASTTYSRLPVLQCSAGELRGQTYLDAQAILAVQSRPQRDGRVLIELTPELHHGQPRQQWVTGQGTLMLETARPKQVYKDMAVSATLAPGGMLVLSALPNRPGSLGHHFFTERDGAVEQKLLLVRLAQTQHDGVFSPPEVLELDGQHDGALPTTAR